MTEPANNIKEYLIKHFGQKFLNSYMDFISATSLPYLRISKNNKSENDLIISLSKYGIELEKVKNIPNAYKILKGQKNAGKTIEFALGKYYIQSLSSMIPPLVLNPSSGEKVFDCCAAPGSKTTQLADLMNTGGTLIANEPSIPRVKALAYNVDKLLSVNVGISKIKGELISKYSDHFFDKILVDAPCSALGILQKKGEVSNWWNVEHVERIASLQIKLLVSAIKALKTGGELVYSTCTLTLEENELIINKILEKYPVELMEIELPVKSVNGFTKYNGIKLNEQLYKSRRIIPWEINSEGFFIAKLKKTGRTVPLEKFTFKHRGLKLLLPHKNPVSKYLKKLIDYYKIDPNVFENYKFLLKKNEMFIVDKNWDSPLLDLLIRVGIPFAYIGKNDEIKLHSHGAQLLSNKINANIVNLEDEDQLKKYFEGGIFNYNSSRSGQKIITYKNLTLGTGILFDKKIKSQFPRSKRTHDIIFPSN